MAHNRKFVPGMVDIMKSRIKNDMLIGNRIQDDIEEIIIKSSILEHVPFKWIGLIYHYTQRTKLLPDYRRINKKYGDLPIAIELRMDILQWADRNNFDLMYDMFMIGALEAMIHVCQKYKLPDDVFRAERAKFGNIPESIEECEEHYAKQ